MLQLFLEDIKMETGDYIAISILGFIVLLWVNLKMMGVI
jgi:hypothetical protein